jgi:hypothetical protein
MMVTRHFRRRWIILSVYTLGFVIFSFSVVLASDFSGPVVSVLDGDTIKSYTANVLNASASMHCLCKPEVPFLGVEIG